MLIVCPTCATSYMVDPSALGEAGRTVRCARCKAAWFAGGPEHKADPVGGFVEDVIAEAQARELAPAMSPPGAATIADGSRSAGDADQTGESPTPDDARAREEAIPASGEDSRPAAYEDSPSLVPPLAHDPLPESQENSSLSGDDGEKFVARRTRMQEQRKIRRRSSKWTALVLLLFGFNVAIIGARQEVVRYLPQTASLFAAIGLPVNLRGLTFADVKVSREENDGLTVLVVEGNIVSSSPTPVEVPRLRFAVRNSGGQEIYAWTALPTRSILGPKETLPFRSRLASPPGDASDVLVRFFSAQDGLAPK